MKVLILSCNTGGGHNAVAAAVKELYERHGDVAVIVDALHFLPHGWSEITSEAHSYIYRHAPKLFRDGYRHVENHPRHFNKGHTIRRLLDNGTRKLGSYILCNHFEQVICCHVFAGIMLTDTIKRYDLQIRSGLIETDYTITPGSEKCALEHHFVPSSLVRKSLSRTCISPDSITVTGIPIREQFCHTEDKAKARQLLGLRQDVKNILIVCGSMGCGPMGEILEYLVQFGKDKCCDFSVLCGTNKSLFEQLSGKYQQEPNVHVFDRVDNMALHLDAADVYITKPGGISITEAAKKEKPMMLINAVGGCEQYNMEYFLASGGAYTADEPSELAQQALALCEDELLYQTMQINLRRIFSENDIEKIYEEMKCPHQKDET